MPDENDFQATFEKLKAILKPYEGKLVVVHNTAKDYYLDTSSLEIRASIISCQMNKGG
jgi:hypothetical protein